MGYYGGLKYVPYREIALPPSDETTALNLIRSVIERHVGRLQELLAKHEEIEADEAAERYDRAALIAARSSSGTGGTSRPGPGGLLRTLDMLRKMRKEEVGTCK